LIFLKSMFLEKHFFLNACWEFDCFS